MTAHTRTSMTMPWTGKYSLERQIAALRCLATMPSESDARAQARGEHLMEQASKMQESESDSSKDGEEKKPMRLRDVSVHVRAFL